MSSTIRRVDITRAGSQLGFSVVTQVRSLIFPKIRAPYTTTQCVNGEARGGRTSRAKNAHFSWARKMGKEHRAFACPQSRRCCGHLPFDEHCRVDLFAVVMRDGQSECNVPFVCPDRLVHKTKLFFLRRIALKVTSRASPREFIVELHHCCRPQPPHNTQHTTHDDVGAADRPDNTMPMAVDCVRQLVFSLGCNPRIATLHRVSKLGREDCRKGKY
jgi:hypothetical protein